MNREKVLELAREAMLFPDEVPAMIPSIERFAALIEAELRGDAEPVVIIHSVREGGGVRGMLRKGANAAEVVGKSLYTHPSPAVVRQLVDAVERLRQKAKWINDEQAIVPYDKMMEVKAALAAAKEAGL